MNARNRLFADGRPDEAHHDEEAGEHGNKADRAVGGGGGLVSEGAEDQTEDNSPNDPRGAPDHLGVWSGHEALHPCGFALLLAHGGLLEDVDEPPANGE